MDGNNRWAKANFMPKKLGHKKGAEAAERVIKLCKKYGVKFLTLYTFSSENWNRPADEVDDLMNLLRNYLADEVPGLIEQGVRLKFIGQRERLPADIQQLMSQNERDSLHNEFVLVIALSYGARDEIAAAAREMAHHALRLGSCEGLNIADYISTNDLPDPDLLIRTGGDKRISNFLLWQIAYTELYFCDVYWPDFGEEELIHAINYFNNVERRYGGRNE